MASDPAVVAGGRFLQLDAESGGVYRPGLRHAAQLRCGERHQTNRHHRRITDSAAESGDRRELFRHVDGHLRRPVLQYGQFFSSVFFLKTS